MFSITSTQNTTSSVSSRQELTFSGGKHRKQSNFGWFSKSEGGRHRRSGNAPAHRFITGGAIAIPGASLVGDRITMIEEQPVTALLDVDLVDQQIKQGGHFNCYFLAVLARLLHQPEGEELLNTITIKQELDIRTGKMMIRLHYGMVDKVVEFDLDEVGQLKNGQKPVDAPEMLQILELGYMKLSRKRRNRLPKFQFPDGGAGHTGKIANMGHGYEPLMDMFGCIPFLVDTTRFEKGSQHKSFADFGSAGRNLVRKELEHMEKDREYLYIYSAGTPIRKSKYTSISDSHGREVKVQNQHCYAILHVDLSQDEIMIWDPDPEEFHTPQIQVVTFEAFCHLFNAFEGGYQKRDRVPNRLLGVG